MAPPRVFFTVDMEQDCPPFLNTWRGVPRGTPKLLALLDELGVNATFFVTGQVAERFPGVVESIVASGHELGCHGNTHRVFDSLDEEAARQEIEAASAILRHFAPVVSFRAPNLRFPADYLPLLVAADYRIDSSEAKYKLSYYRKAVCDGLVRAPASVTSSVLRLPRVVRETYLRCLSDPIVLFVHPWEFVDLTKEDLRLDCRFKTGDKALACVADVLRSLQSRGASFGTLRDLIK